jgi:hypothetical protein
MAIIGVWRHHQLMGIVESELCYWYPVRIHQWVSPFVSFNLPRERLYKCPKSLVHVYLLLRQTRNGPKEILWFITKVILFPVQGKKGTAVEDSFHHRLQKRIQSSLKLSFRPYQKETLFETPYFPRKDFKHLLGLTEGNPVGSQLEGKNCEEDILERRNPHMQTHKFKRPNEGIKLGVNLRRG